MIKAFNTSSTCLRLTLTDKTYALKLGTAFQGPSGDFSNIFYAVIWDYLTEVGVL